MIFEMGNTFPVHGQRCNFRIYRLHEHILILRCLKRDISYPQNQTTCMEFGPRSSKCIFYNNTYTPVFREDRVINMLILR